MRRLFRVGEDVFATVSGYEPFPAVVESVRLNESECSVFYYVRLQGAVETIPLNEDNLLSMEENKHNFKWKYNDKDLRRESKIRVDAVFGSQDEIPDVLMNFVTVDSDFEEISDETIRRLGLFSIMLSPIMVDRLDEKMSPRSKEKPEGLDKEDDFVDVEDTDGTDATYLVSGRKRKTPLHSWHSKLKNQKVSKSLKRRSLLKSNQGVWKTGEKLSLKTQTSSNQKNIDLENVDKNEYNNLWSGRLASGSYPCKMCFRKFRSKGEAQSHMAMHKPLEGKGDTQSEADFDFYESEDSSSMKFDERYLKHSSMERQRRAEMAAKFAGLQDALDVPKGTSKQTTLAAAKCKIEELEMQSEEQDREIAFLQEKNERLKARYLELNPEER